MEKGNFIRLVEKYARDPAVKGSLNILAKPPGRKPRQRHVELSTWYNSLNESEREKVKSIAEMTLDLGFFNLLCLLDGVTILSPEYKNGRFELFFRDGNQANLINDEGKDTEELHDLYNIRINED